jgi:hypothetical protein
MQRATNHNIKVVNEVQQDCLRLQAFVSVSEAFLFLFNASKLHHKSFKWITNWFGCVLLNLKNLTQLTTLKMVEHSFWNWPAKFPSMASLHENGFGFQIPQHFSCSEPH